jgi:hypothetical protein
MMKKTLLMVLAIGFAQVATAGSTAGYVDPDASASDASRISSDSQVHKYRSKISIDADCAMPEDMDSPQEGECDVGFSTYEVGTWVEQKDDQCFETTSELVELRSFEVEAGKSIQLPHIKKTTKAIDCTNATQDS